MRHLKVLLFTLLTGLALPAFVAGPYVFERLIPVEYVKQVLSERRMFKGLALPGMPGAKRGPLQVYYLSSEPTPKVFATF